MKRIVSLGMLILLVGCFRMYGQEQKEEVKSSAADSLAYQREIELSEISVVVAKPLIKAEVDKIVYNIADDADSKTNTLLEMLRKVPFVTVDSDDNIKVNGSSSFRIYMNGKPSGILSNNPKETLRSIPAHTIKKIEVITDPGARYDAEGVSGILNVITKGAEFEGYSANLNTTLMSRFQLVGGYTTIKYGKFSLSANYSFSHYISKIKSDSYREQFNNPDETYLTQHFDLRSKTPAHYGGLEASFEIDSLNLITLSGFLNDGRNKITYFNRYGMENSAYNPVYSYGNDIDNHDNWGYSSVKADYQRSFKRNKKEMLTLSYQYGYSPNNMNSFSKITGKEGDSPSLQYLDNYNHQWNKARGTEHTLQLDYVNPFTQQHSVEGGMKYIRRSNSSRAISEIKSGEEEAWRPSGYQPFLTYEHLQNIMAAYAGYTFNNKKWGLNSGIRMEHTWQDVDYKEGQGLDFDYQATDWVPSLSGSFKISDHQNLRLSYNLRLRRPGINYLNPYVKISGSSISYGNPDLESEKHHRITLAYSYFASKFNFQASLLYSTSSGGIGNYQFLDEKNVLNSTYGNIEMSKGGGISTYIGYNPSAKTTLSVNASLYYLDMSLAKEYKDLLLGLSNNGINGGIYTNFSQKFNYGWRLALSGGCGKQEITLGYYPEIFYYYGTSVSKSFGGEKLTVSLRAQNFLQPYTKTTSKQVYPDFHLKQNVRYYDNAFGITVSYRFGELKESVRKASRSIANDDLMKSE
ncbi:outer membrane beta-barrel family protein [Parabacteroides segnis]|uniref:TonB-dependent receptor domain-containing protein n=1 Tax=Parabacteroides segnis TaxID=2763058 RepID=UPI003518D512